MVHGFNLIKKSRTVVKKSVDEEALGYLQKVLNKSQPTTPEEIILHKFVKGMYNENKRRFLAFIKGSRLESLILWTESRVIVNYLGLRDLVYIKWKGEELYLVTPFNKVNGTVNHPLCETTIVTPVNELVTSPAPSVQPHTGEWGDAGAD